MSEPTPLYYTFGNHMHWVDMEWLWGYHVLPGSVHDMLRFCKETGAKGNVNFDGIGYEKLASENPEAFQELREAIRSGQVEVVGGSYGQPYGLFHGGESNVRQRIYGVRTCLRLFGVRPKSFWEEEFDFFPQLPQMLNGCGFEYSSLFFQWTWHTPEVPKESVSAVLWEGVDGSRLLCAPRNELNLHQWPEDMQILLDQLSRGESPVSGIEDIPPLILQWLELMPSPDWMCRSEVLLPKMRELMNDPRFEVKVATLGEYLALHKGKDLPVRRYGMGDVWHGLSLGKNGDAAPKASARAEATLRTAEGLASMLGLFGRPYPTWDVYPVWEFEEAWRNLLAAQHHDNHECEGLCGHVANRQVHLAEGLAMRGESDIRMLASRVGMQEDEQLIYNGCGWKRKLRVRTDLGLQIVELPAFGYCVVPSVAGEEEPEWVQDGGLYTWHDSGRTLIFDSAKLTLSWADANGVVEHTLEMPKSSCVRQGQSEVSGGQFKVDADANELFVGLEPNFDYAYWIRAFSGLDQVEIEVSFESLKDFDPGLQGGGKVNWSFPFEVSQIVADAPYQTYIVGESKPGVRKYPEGDWMTSSQWFEDVRDHFTAQSLVDVLAEDGTGLLIAHDGGQQWFKTETGLANQIITIDPWDEVHSGRYGRVKYHLYWHSGLADRERWQRAQELTAAQSTHTERREFDEMVRPSIGDLPREFAPFELQASGSLLQAVYRETEDYSGMRLETYAGQGMGYPYVLRLVEWNGEEDECELTVAGTVAKAFRTNLLGEVEEVLEIEVIQGATPPSIPPRRGEGGPSASVEVGTLTPTPAPLPLAAQGEGNLEATPPSVPPRRGEGGPENEAVRHPFTGASSKLRFKMRPHEIATLYLDIVEGRKQPRDLDAKREVWAASHRR